MQSFADKIDNLLAMPPYAQPPEEREASLLEVFKEELDYACERHSGYKNYVKHWPSDYRSATRVADLPFLPVRMLKANPPLSFVSSAEGRIRLQHSHWEK